VYQVDSAVKVLHLGEGDGQGVRIADVARDGYGERAGFPDQTLGLLAIVGIEVEDGHCKRPGPCDAHGRRSADSAGRSRDEGDLSLKDPAVYCVAHAIPHSSAHY
jgi:hypothetical protein